MPDSLTDSANSEYDASLLENFSALLRTKLDPIFLDVWRLRDDPNARSASYEWIEMDESGEEIDRGEIFNLEDSVEYDQQAIRRAKNRLKEAMEKAISSGDTTFHSKIGRYMVLADKLNAKLDGREESSKAATLKVLASYSLTLLRAYCPGVTIHQAHLKACMGPDLEAMEIKVSDMEWNRLFTTDEFSGVKPAKSWAATRDEDGVFLFIDGL